MNCVDRCSFHYDLNTQKGANYKVNKDLRKIYGSMAIGLQVS